MLVASSLAYGAEVSGNVSLATDYVYRGISQTNEEATIQGGFDLETDSGFYAGVWASNIAFDGSIEIDLYAGIGGEISENFGYDVGVLRYQYPSDAGPNDSSFNEIYGSLSYGGFTAGLNYSPDFFFESGKATYVYLEYSLPLPNEFSVDFHYGNQTIDDNGTFGAPDYAEYYIAVSRSWSDLDFSLTWYDTDLSGADCFGGSAVCDSRVVFGLSKSL